MALRLYGDGAVTGVASVETPTTLSGLTIPTTGFGKVLQVVHVSTATSLSTTLSDKDVTELTAAITPSSTSSKVLVVVSAYMRATASSGNCYAKLGFKRNGTQLVNGYSIGNFGSTDIRGMGNIVFVDSPSTTSSTTYLVTYGALATSAYINNSGGSSSITLMEIAA